MLDLIFLFSFGGLIFSFLFARGNIKPSLVTAFLSIALILHILTSCHELFIILFGLITPGESLGGFEQKCGLVLQNSHISGLINNFFFLLRKDNVLSYLVMPVLSLSVLTVLSFGWHSTWTTEGLCLTVISYWCNLSSILSFLKNSSSVLQQRCPLWLCNQFINLTICLVFIFTFRDNTKKKKN